MASPRRSKESPRLPRPSSELQEKLLRRRWLTDTPSPIIASSDDTSCIAIGPSISAENLRSIHTRLLAWSSELLEREQSIVEREKKVEAREECVPGEGKRAGIPLHFDLAADDRDGSPHMPSIAARERHTEALDVAEPEQQPEALDDKEREEHPEARGQCGTAEKWWSEALDVVGALDGQTLTEREQHLQVREQIVSDRERQAQSLKVEATSYLEALVERERHLEEREQCIIAKERQSEVLELVATSDLEAFAERERQLEEREQRVTAREKQTEALSLVVTSDLQALTERERQLEAREHRVTARERRTEVHKSGATEDLDNEVHIASLREHKSMLQADLEGHASHPLTKSVENLECCNSRELNKADVMKSSMTTFTSRCSKLIEVKLFFGEVPTACRVRTGVPTASVKPPALFGSLFGEVRLPCSLTKSTRHQVENVEQKMLSSSTIASMHTVLSEGRLDIRRAQRDVWSEAFVQLKYIHRTPHSLTPYQQQVTLQFLEELPEVCPLKKSQIESVLRFLMTIDSWREVAQDLLTRSSRFFPLLSRSTIADEACAYEIYGCDPAT